MTKNIAVIRGDGIGPEIVNEALRVLDKIAELYGHTFHYTDVDMGGCAIDKWGDPLPQEMLDKCVASDSVLLGAVGGDKWNDVPGPKRPEKGLLRLRAGMGVYSNNRPAKIWPQLSDASPLKKSIVEKGIDFIIVRELIGGIYFGEHKTDDADGQPVATDIMKYSEAEIERIGRIGFETARKHSMQGQGSQSVAASYIGLEKEDGSMFWGAGTDTDVVKANTKALLSAYNNMIKGGN